MAVALAARVPQILGRLRIGACLTVTSIFLCLLGLKTIGAWVAVIGLTLLMWSLHQLGRSGSA